MSKAGGGGRLCPHISARSPSPPDLQTQHHPWTVSNHENRSSGWGRGRLDLFGSQRAVGRGPQIDKAGWSWPYLSRDIGYPTLPSTQQFIQPTFPTLSIIWDIFEKNPHHMSIVHDIDEMTKERNMDYFLHFALRYPLLCLVYFIDFLVRYFVKLLLLIFEAFAKPHELFKIPRNLSSQFLSAL